MIIEKTKISGVKVITLQPSHDERGYFTRVFCQTELREIQANLNVEQINRSMTKQRGTIRGMHFQYPPHAETKIVFCLKGSVFDVALDLRTNSDTFLKWHNEILSEKNMKALVIPEGCAHGFQALEDNVELLYLHTKAYCKNSEGTIRYDDPSIAIAWPIAATNISEKDLSYPFINGNFAGVEV